MWKISLAFILIAGLSTFYFTSSAYKQTSDSIQQRTFFDATGKLHVMGVVLEESTLRDAEIAFRSRSDSAVFLYPKETKEGQEPQFTGKLEAYFPSIADHTKILLTMIISDADLETMRQRSSKPRIYPNGVIRMNLSSQDILGIQRMVIQELTLIPNLQLDERTIFAQFGKPTITTKVSSSETIYTFPNIGLTATINNEGKDKLIFRNKN
ncbi:MAG: hypothetical protein Q9N67_04090 [Ghiorsea sp.]|nr:hypothetical protein [Ghiorsea sp.]